MNNHTHAYIAYIVGRIIARKKIDVLYDYSQFRDVEIVKLPDGERLRDFNYVNWSYMSNQSGINRFKYSCSSGHSIDIRIKGNTFIGHIPESSAHIIGNVRGDTICLYDQKESVHFNYRIIDSAIKR